MASPDACSKRPTLRARRANPPPFCGEFYLGHEDFLPLRIGAVTFADRDAWPALHEYDALLRGLPFSLRVVEARASRRGRSAADPSAVYDAYIVRRGELPTRPRDWHDYLNALTWVAFPHAKMALHKRQLAELERAIAEHGRLPNARSPLHDLLAVLDEGGVLEVTDGVRRRRLIFGHALHEGRIYDLPSMVARMLPLRVRHLPDDAIEALRVADSAFAAVLPTLTRRVRDLPVVRL